MTESIKTYFRVLTLSATLCLCTISLAQDSTNVDVFDLIDTHSVRWVDQIPTLQVDSKSKKKGWFKRIILGNSDFSSFQKPIAVIPLNTEQTIIFDQGHGTIFIAEDQELEIPRLLRKKGTYFPSLVDACLLPDQSVIFSDSKLNKIYKLSKDHKQLSELNTGLVLTQPTGIIFNSTTQQIWVVETASHRISILDAYGNRIKTIGHRGTKQAEFNYPTSICVGAEGNVYVVDALNYRIQIFNPQGVFISMFGENGNGTGFLARPKGIATDSYGHIYVVDALFHSVQIFDEDGSYLYQFGKQGSNTEEFWMPSGIFIDTNNHIFIADSYNSRIQIFELNYNK